MSEITTFFLTIFKNECIIIMSDISTFVKIKIKTEVNAYDCIKKSLIITTKSKTKQNFYKIIIPHFPLERGEYGYK